MTAQRKRSLDINKLSVEEADRLSAQIGDKVTKITDEACAKANELLNIYGMKAIMQIVFEPINKEEPKAPKKTRGRPKKADNL